MKVEHRTTTTYTLGTCTKAEMPALMYWHTNVHTFVLSLTHSFVRSSRRVCARMYAYRTKMAGISTHTRASNRIPLYFFKWLKSALIVHLPNGYLYREWAIAYTFSHHCCSAFLFLPLRFVVFDCAARQGDVSCAIKYILFDVTKCTLIPVILSQLLKQYSRFFIGFFFRFRFVHFIRRFIDFWNCMNEKLTKKKIKPFPCNY